MKSDENYVKKVDFMKKDLYIDFDSTIVNSDKAICRIYNERYSTYENFVPADWRKHSNWAYKNVCPLIHTHENDPVKVIKDLFGDQDFFDYLEFYDDAKKCYWSPGRKVQRDHLYICISNECI